MTRSEPLKAVFLTIIDVWLPDMQTDVLWSIYGRMDGEGGGVTAYDHAWVRSGTSVIPVSQFIWRALVFLFFFLAQNFGDEWP